MGIGKAILSGLNFLGEAMMAIYKPSEIDTLNRAKEILKSHSEYDAVKAIEEVLQKAVVSSNTITTKETPFGPIYTTTASQPINTYATSAELMDSIKKGISKRFPCIGGGVYHITTNIYAKPIYQSTGVSIVLTHKAFDLYSIRDDINISRIRVDKCGHGSTFIKTGSPYEKELKIAIEGILDATEFKKIK